VAAQGLPNGCCRWSTSNSGSWRDSEWRVSGPGWAGRSHFFFAAAEAMRRILIDHARARAGPRRGGGRRRVPLHNVLDLAAAEEDFPEILALDDALSRLEKMSERVGAVVRLRFYAGLSIEEVARTLDVSPRTVKADWTYARAWLARELADNADRAVE
jgi:RNA polymerase sigma-70 factor, ECF subfamily